MQVEIRNSAIKTLEKIENKDKIAFYEISSFLDDLSQVKNPFTLPNVKKLSGYKDRWRWRIDNYRIIGIKSKNEQNQDVVIIIIEIDKRSKVYKNLEK